MSLANISLTDYDNVVAVTQMAINQTMGEYLMAHPTKVALYGKDDGHGDVILLPDSTGADCFFTGTLAPEQDANRAWINIVELYTDKGNQTIRYNVTFKYSEFKAPKWQLDIKQDGPWVVRFTVKLALQDVAKGALPDDVKKQLLKVDENMFAIQQLYMDLNTTGLESYEGIDIPAFVKGVLESLLKQYLKQQQKESKPLFGVAVKFKHANVAPPTLTPTDVNFCVTPYRDAAGKNTNPNLDTLNYLVMTNHNPPPAYPPASFPFNWVDDPKTHGAMAIKRQPFVDFLVPQLNPILITLCQDVHCEVHPDWTDQVIKLIPSTRNNEFNRISGAPADMIAFYSYNSQDSDSKSATYPASWTLEVSGTYSMQCNVFLTGDKVRIAGYITASADNYSSTNNRGTDVKMPKTTFQWFVELQLYMDAANNGQLDLKVGAQDFNSKPTVENDPDLSGWERFLNTLAGSMKIYVNNLGDMRVQVQEHVMSNVVPALKGVLTQANHFILPGAKTFAFKNPTFSKSLDLASDITYLNPNA